MKTIFELEHIRQYLKGMLSLIVSRCVDRVVEEGSTQFLMKRLFVEIDMSIEEAVFNIQAHYPHLGLSNDEIRSITITYFEENSKKELSAYILKKYGVLEIDELSKQDVLKNAFKEDENWKKEILIKEVPNYLDEVVITTSKKQTIEETMYILDQTMKQKFAKKEDELWYWNGNVQDMNVVVNPPNNSNNPYDISLAQTLFWSSLSTSVAKTIDFLNTQTNGFSLKYDLVYSPFNRITGRNRTWFSIPKQNTGKIIGGLKGFGYGISIYGSFQIEENYGKDLISEGERYHSHALNLIGTFSPPQVGVAIAAGDYLGKKYHSDFENQVTNDEAWLNKIAQFMLQAGGIPISEEDAKKNYNK
ncbi:hypothetical protein H0I23_00880 [Cellulophaga sp. HaHaR_3_176]|uniref:hypothetical protein n=1 Tax=Cellulophaga sp. HaHaR_3_176 TaxID=1942464 RepID=UPI001C1FAE17|nr:hypothetical protein [Cellulophaga sp. HaHaR_3_176]QWX84237.1 hypothetical protein H0I23_00880 [Cellulophaga sp. HaHaR_3_176]